MLAECFLTTTDGVFDVWCFFIAVLKLPKIGCLLFNGSQSVRFVRRAIYTVVFEEGNIAIFGVLNIIIVWLVELYQLMLQLAELDDLLGDLEQRLLMRNFLLRRNRPGLITFVLAGRGKWSLGLLLFFGFAVEKVFDFRTKPGGIVRRKVNRKKFCIFYVWFVCKAFLDVFLVKL